MSKGLSTRTESTSEPDESKGPAWTHSRWLWGPGLGS